MSRALKEEFWREVSQKHYLVKHENLVEGADGEINIRRSFIGISEEDGLDSALNNWINFPCVVMIGREHYRPVDKNGSIRKKFFNKLFFLDKPVQNADEVTEAPSIQRAYDRAQQVMEDFVSEVQETYEEEGSCGPFKYFDISECVMTETGNIAGGLRGWSWEWPDEESAADLLDKDVTHWTGNPVSGGSSGSSVPVADSGNVGELDPAPTGRHYSVHMHNVRSTTMSLYIDKQASIDWGDGTPVKHYPGDFIINHKYEDVGDDPIELKVYWEVNAPNVLRQVYVKSGGSTPNTAIIDSIDGVLPTNAWRFQVSNGLSVFPFDLLPTTIKYVNVQGCSFNVATLNAIMQMYIDLNIHNGLLKINLQNPRVTDIDQTLRQAIQDMNTPVDYDQA
jgi:hypothetical protein